MKKHLFVLGTRPEAIKLAPLILRCRERPCEIAAKVCVTGQHREMLDDVLGFFGIAPDYDLNVMRPEQSLFDITIRGLAGLQKVLDEYRPDNIFVEGDTTTVLVGALAGFYAGARVSHVEAGLRSGDTRSPYPEEMNRILVGHLADFHFAPTENAARNLHNEGIRKNVWVVGNPVIDALLLGLKMIRAAGEAEYLAFFGFQDLSRPILLVTCHRRESFGRPFEEICAALGELARGFPEIEIVYPVHPNPRITEPARRILGGMPNIRLIPPLTYPRLIWLMSRSSFVLTDSGGIQEEAPALGKPVLVLRDVTERVEGVQAGTARVVGTGKDAILREASRLLTDRGAYEAMAKAVNPYGDGTASERILKIISGEL